MPIAPDSKLGQEFADFLADRLVEVQAEIVSYFERAVAGCPVEGNRSPIALRFSPLDDCGHEGWRPRGKPSLQHGKDECGSLTAVVPNLELVSCEKSARPPPKMNVQRGVSYDKCSLLDQPKILLQPLHGEDLTKPIYPLELKALSADSQSEDSAVLPLERETNASPSHASRLQSKESLKVPLRDRSHTMHSQKSQLNWISPSRQSVRSVSTFASVLQTVETDKQMLLRLFKTCEDIEAEEIEYRELGADIVAYAKKWSIKMNNSESEMTLDSIMGFVICLNALFIGAQADYDRGEIGWLAADLVFSALFCIEILLKLNMNGVCGQFCGPARYANCFDAFLIIVDLLQLAITLFFPDVSEDMAKAPSASLFRVIRLVKLARILRLLKSPVFKDLLAMIQGMIGGMSTLGWSMILFLIALYVAALILRESLGRRKHESIHEYFDNMPRSMFTTFRCSFGDCTTDGGTPIFEHVQDEYGFYQMFYCVFSFTMTVGLFNVISAIFVESTMEAAKVIESNRKKARLRDDALLAMGVTTLVRIIVGNCIDLDLPDKFSEAVDELYDLDIPLAVVDQLIKEPDARHALASLDILEDDVEHLSDILDPDNGGTIKIIELLGGIERLRGEPRRSDMVTIDLMIRSLHRAVADLQEALQE